MDLPDQIIHTPDAQQDICLINNKHHLLNLVRMNIKQQYGNANAKNISNIKIVANTKNIMN